jgi:hypothetical protein
MTIRPVGAELFHTDWQTHRRTDEPTDRQTDRQTDRHDEANSRFSQFFERAWKCYLGLFQTFQYVGDFFDTLRVTESIVRERNIWACFRGLLLKKGKHLLSRLIPGTWFYEAIANR